MGLTDAEFASWLMDEANAETVRIVLSTGGQAFDVLNVRIDAIINGENVELAQMVSEYIAMLFEVNLLAEEVQYIYFDLAAGNVTIGPSGYTGYVYVSGGDTPTEIKGKHEDSNKYYVYQSTAQNRKETGYVNGVAKIANTCKIPTYNRVSHGIQSWSNYITNNTDVKGVSKAWDDAAADVGRTGTPYKITFTSGSNYDVTIDNIWSTYHEVNHSRTTGGIGAHLGTSRNTKITLRLKGDNRVGCVHYSAEKDCGNQIIFENGDDHSIPGSITVADFNKNWAGNHWNAVIGSSDNGVDRSDGIVINGGVIYAGSTRGDNCTAIGGGGNAYGRVTITGGTVTAVSASTGTAIGGGIGWGSRGGDANINISGGVVYAYNLGIGEGTTDGYKHYVPAAAIGGGSAESNTGNERTNVTITGGTVYAESMGGAAIGGGGSGQKTGGPATINISGGTIIAKSTTGSFKGTSISAGVSIGGGTGDTGGGSVELNVSGGTLRTGSIGGGKTNTSGNIGSANVTITGGDITGQVIMAGGASKSCSFNMSSGKIHGTNVVEGNTITDINDPRPETRILYTKKNGGALWMEDSKGIANVTGGTIENCTALLGGAIYMEGGTFTLSEDGIIQNNQAVRSEDESAALQGYGGGVYIIGGTADIMGGFLQKNTAQVRGGGLYVRGGNVTVSGGSILSNVAGSGENLPADAGRGGGVYLEGGLFTMDTASGEGGIISGNTANYRGGGIFLTEAPSLIKGVLSGNKATDSGGGVCINGAELKLESTGMKIYGNTARNGGGVAVLNGDFILSGGAVGVEGAAADGEKKPNTATKGGGVYVEALSTGTGTAAAANAKVYSGNIWYNEAEEGGGVYLARGEGDFTLDGSTAVISHNKAKNGGGVYLYKDPYLNEGTVEQNEAAENGGGMYISDCLVTLNATGDVIIAENKAQNGAGIYIHGLTESSGSSGTPGGQVDAVSAATPEHKVGLLVDANITGTVHFTKNAASVSGGAVCVDVGRFELRSGNVTVAGNKAQNGGGVAVLKGNFTMTDGAIGQSNVANHATNGGGVYVSGGEIWFKGGSVAYNEATDGGGAYVTGGQLVMLNGSLASNTATGNGGGGYVAGDFHMLDGTISGNSATNGGGIHVNDGNVTVVYGDISGNHAAKDGGGFHVFTAGEKVEVVMLSGSLSGNRANVNGGGMAVESESDQPISVKIGCLRNHNVKDGRPTLSIPYAGDYAGYAEFDGKTYEHESCPKVKDNQAGGIGGGFYMNSDASTLSFYCVEETDNNAQGAAGMDVEGGTVIIGDEYYHNHIHDKDQPNRHVVPWGYISMDDATLVTGGKVDIYGDMTNPVFKDKVAVDIQDKVNDHFIDHRRARKDEKRYKVHYIENFFGTGLYEEHQYDESDTLLTIGSALYSHPGYEILGWYTKADYDPTVVDTNHTFYEVGKTYDLSDKGQVQQMGMHSTDCTICGVDNQDTNLLKLYAIWEANGYTVVFDPNVPKGDTYTGTMENQVLSYGVQAELTPNAYNYPGNFFKSWNTEPDGSGVTYADGAEVLNLTDQNGVEVMLYAQWEPCDHKDPERWSYEVPEDDPKKLLRICSCGGQTLEATLSAENTTYNGLEHPATLKCNDEAAWGNDKPTVVYTAAWLENAYHGEGEAPALSEKGKPYHAGKYTASITKPDAEGTEKVTASVTYTISKADQKAPSKPTYTVPDGSENVVIDKVPQRELTDDGGRTNTAQAEYRLSYYEGETFTSQAWKRIEGDSQTIALHMDNAWTGYYAEARYQELDDYNASPVARADAMYFYGGGVTVIIVCDDGIDYTFVPKVNGESIIENGATLNLKTKDGYYIVSGEYSVTTQVEPTPDDPSHPTVTKENATEKEGKYTVTGIPGNSTLTITIGTARKAPQVSAQAAPGQVFRPITGTETAISKDSAFTAAFQISNFAQSYKVDGNSYDAYTGLNVTFDPAIPDGSTMILLDRRDGSYWYHLGGGGSVPLTAFKKMGESGTAYSIPAPAADDGYVDLSYQFIVDFSQCASFDESNLTMALEAPKASPTSDDGATGGTGAVNAAPEIKPAVTVSRKTSSFTFTTAGANGSTCEFSCEFTKGAAASKWENRASALVLTPNEDLPPDAHLKVVTGGGTTELYKTGESFIVPLSLLQEGTKTVSVTLGSTLFPKTATEYHFTAEWQISQSKAGKAPLNGYLAGSANVTFTSAQKTVPSLKSTGTTRMLTSSDELVLTLTTKNMDGYTATATLLHKSSGGSYVGTGWRQPNVSSEQLEIPLGGQTPGSYCLMITVKKNNSITTVMQVPYYFVIKE